MEKACDVPSATCDVVGQKSGRIEGWQRLFNGIIYTGFTERISKENIQIGGSLNEQKK